MGRIRILVEDDGDLRAQVRDLVLGTARGMARRELREIVVEAFAGEGQKAVGARLRDMRDRMEAIVREEARKILTPIVERMARDLGREMGERLRSRLLPAVDRALAAAIEPEEGGVR